MGTWKKWTLNYLLKTDKVYFTVHKTLLYKSPLHSFALIVKIAFQVSLDFSHSECKGKRSGSRPILSKRIIHRFKFVTLSRCSATLEFTMSYNALGWASWILCTIVNPLVSCIVITHSHLSSWPLQTNYMYYKQPVWSPWS